MAATASTLLIVLALFNSAGCARRDAPKSARPAAPIAPADAASAAGAPEAGAQGDEAPGEAVLPAPPAGSHPADAGGHEPRPEARARAPQGPRISITLHSTPPGALVSVDGEAMGRTPAHWEGVADGRPHEFTFVLPGHAPARYRFVPTTDGVVHGRLEPLAEPPADRLRQGAASK